MNKLSKPALFLLVFSIILLLWPGITYASFVPGQELEEVVPVIEDTLQHASTEAEISSTHTGEISHAGEPAHDEAPGEEPAGSAIYGFQPFVRR